MSSTQILFSLAVGGGPQFCSDCRSLKNQGKKEDKNKMFCLLQELKEKAPTGDVSNQGKNFYSGVWKFMHKW